jgi:hypothetical protein
MALVEVSKLDVLVLKKLVLVNVGLAKALSDPRAASEQFSLAKHLNEITLRADFAVSSEPAPVSQDNCTGGE